MVVNPNTTVRKFISLPRDLLREVDDFRFANRIGTESEAVRQLMRLGLAAAKAVVERENGE